MPDIEDAPDLFEPMPETDGADATGEEASRAADQHHGEVDEIAADADPDGPGHGPSDQG